MKMKSFVILMTVLALVLACMVFAVIRTLFASPSVPAEVEVRTDPITKKEVEHRDPGAISWEDPKIEVGKLTYTITHAQVFTNVYNAGSGSVRENAIFNMYDGNLYDAYRVNPDAPNDGYCTTFYYPYCIDANGNLLGGGSMVVLDIRVDSEDAVNFVTDPETGVQSRRYPDNPFLFRADEITFLLDTEDDTTAGLTYYDAVYFNAMDAFSEHPMAYELLPGESISFRIGFFMGNRKNGSPRDFRDVVASTGWHTEDEEYFSLNLA